ncbi:MAG: hypothetical protein AB8B64_17475 [Granulosicoccus sp.]
MSSTETQDTDGATESFVTVTPAGCYYVVESSDPTIARQLLTKILAKPLSPALSDFHGLDRESLVELQKSGFVMFNERSLTLPSGNLMSLLPHVLPALSERERVVLTESRQGLYLDYSGITREEAEELAVMAANFRKMAEKRSSLLDGKLSINSRAFGVIDPAGNSEIGFWPLHISDNVFTLIILGIPRFNSAQFSTLIWALVERYGAQDEE